MAKSPSQSDQNASVTLYDYWESGNCYKVRLLLTQLSIPFRLESVDILQAETRTDSFLELNPNGRVPTLVFDDGRRLCESNAILMYMARDSALLPDDPFEVAQALQWMFFEQYSHEPFVAVVRFWHFSGTLDAHQAELDGKMAGGYAALDVMEQHLADHQFFVGERYSVADIALYAYTHVAGEGGFDLARFPSIQAWINRVAEQPQHVRLDAQRP